MAITSTNPAADAGGYQNIARAISAYGQQAFTDAQEIVSTGITGGAVTLGGSSIVSESEDYYGTIRFDKAADDVTYLGDSGHSTNLTKINIATETDTEGEFSEFRMATAEYIKTYRTHGANDYLVTPVITRRSGAIEKIGENFGRTRARDADKQFVSVLKGVIGQEVSRAKAVGASDGARTEASGAFGVRESNMLPEAGGFYYDLNYKANQTTAGTETLIGATKGSNVVNKGGGAVVFESVLKAQTYGFSDVEVPFMYLIIDPRTYLDIQLANLLDEDHVTDGNITMRTVLNGAYRLIVTRTSLGDYATGAQAHTAANGYVDDAVTDQKVAINKGSTRTSILARPDAVAFVPMGVNRPVAVDRDESTGRGAGRDEIWYRWGGIMHPYGYSWNGYKQAFARNDDIASSATISPAYGGSSSDSKTRQRGYSGAANWERVESAGNLRLLPVFHS